MNYIKGETIKELRIKNNMTQLKLANLLNLSEKTISKWETGRGMPDITNLSLLAKVLNVSVTELFLNKQMINENKSGNMLKLKIYVCPICGNIIYSLGDSVISCCGNTLQSLIVNNNNENHKIKIEKIEDEYFITTSHPMNKNHYISFILYITNDNCEIIKLYPENTLQAMFKIKGHGYIYIYCNQEGLFQKKV